MWAYEGDVQRHFPVQNRIRCILCQEAEFVCLLSEVFGCRGTSLHKEIHIAHFIFTYYLRTYKGNAFLFMVYTVCIFLSQCVEGVGFVVYKHVN